MASSRASSRVAPAVMTDGTAGMRAVVQPFSAGSKLMVTSVPKSLRDTPAPFIGFDMPEGAPSDRNWPPRSMHLTEERQNRDCIFEIPEPGTQLHRVYTAALQSPTMGRKRRAKRARHAEKDVSSARSSPGESESAHSALPSFALRRPARPGHVGARVARVAVDDETWASFRELCGETPASVRLAQLVEADVQRAREATPESKAVAALRSIRAHTDQLEAFIRDGRN